MIDYLDHLIVQKLIFPNIALCRSDQKAIIKYLWKMFITDDIVWFWFVTINIITVQLGQALIMKCLKIAGFPYSKVRFFKIKVTCPLSITCIYVMLYAGMWSTDKLIIWSISCVTGAAGQEPPRSLPYSLSSLPPHAQVDPMLHYRMSSMYPPGSRER